MKLKCKKDFHMLDDNSIAFVSGNIYNGKHLCTDETGIEIYVFKNERCEEHCLEGSDLTEFFEKDGS